MLGGQAEGIYGLPHDSTLRPDLKKLDTELSHRCKLLYLDLAISVLEQTQTQNSEEGQAKHPQ